MHLKGSQHNSVARKHEFSALINYLVVAWVKTRGILSRLLCPNGTMNCVRTVDERINCVIHYFCPELLLHCVSERKEAQRDRRNAREKEIKFEENTTTINAVLCELDALATFEERKQKYKNSKFHVFSHDFLMPMRFHRACRENTTKIKKRRISILWVLARLLLPSVVALECIQLRGTLEQPVKSNNKWGGGGEWNNEKKKVFFSGAQQKRVNIIYESHRCLLSQRYILSSTLDCLIFFSIFIVFLLSREIGGIWRIFIDEFEWLCGDFDERILLSL